MKSKQIGNNKQNGSEFSMLLEKSFQERSDLLPGSALTVTVTDNKHEDFIFVKSEKGKGLIAREELLDEAGHISVNNGEKLNVFFLSMEGGELLFTTIPKGRAKEAVIREAMESGVPIKGKIRKSIKGGFEIMIGDTVAFCPLSQIDRDAQPGEIRSFIVIEAANRRVVVSHRMYRDMETKKQKEQMQSSLEEGDIVSGRVSNVTNFGAFVDLGGIEGLIPVSECSYKRIQHPSEVLSTGQEVRVKILALDWKENRITLSLKSLLQNPWQGALPFSEGEILEGEIEGIRPFGVFVRLPEHFIGLVPLAETGIPRGKSPEKEFVSGTKVRVMVREINRDREKISLSIKAVEEAQTRKEYEDYMKDQNTEERGEVSSFGKALLESLQKGKK